MRISDWSSDVCSSDLKIERDTGITGAMARQRYEELVPLGRLGEALDVAYGVLYFASDESRHVTGAQLVIDGGSTQIGRAHVELQSLMRISYAVFCLKKKKQITQKRSQPKDKREKIPNKPTQ